MQDIQFYRKLLFKTCESKEDLQRWTRIFLKVDLPDCIVSEESNSSPADLVWEIYSKSKDNNDEKFARVMAYASRGSFKCQVKGSKLLDKDKGAVCIENVKVGDVIWSGWNWRKVTNWIHDGIKASKKLTLQDGTVLEGSPIHRYWAWGPNGVPGWKRSDELTTNDYIMADVSHKYGDQPIVQEEFDKGYLCGILQGDGGLSFMDRLGMVSLTGTSGPSVDFWLDFCAKNGYHVRAKKQFEHSKATTYTVYSKSKLVPFLKSLGLKNSRSWEKEIPSFAWTSKSAMAGFVTGLFDTDGSINKSKNAVLFQLTATKLLQELPILLRALGVNSQLHHLKLGKLNKHPVSIVSIGMHETIKLLKSGVKLVKGSKKNEFNALYDPQKKNIDDSISKSMLASLLAKLPTQGGRWRKAKMFKPRIGYDNISRAKCKDLVKYAEVNGLLEQKDIDYWSAVFENKWVRVSKIEDGQADFYDLTVETDHSYWSNGFISHNTLGASILEILTIFHLDRNVGHMAATGDQSERSQEYVRDFLNMPYLIDFKVGDSKKRIEIIRFTDSKTGNIYTEEEYKALTPDIKTRCSRKSSWIKIVICSLAGANGLHAEFFCVDGETDVKTDFNNTIKAKDIKIGTEILSYNFDTGALEKLPVVNLVKTNKKALKIRATDGEIITSEDHPFYIEGKGFVQAGQLNVGDKTTHPGRYFAQKSPPKKPLETKPIDGTVIEQVADEWEQVLLGSLLGDMGIYKKAKNNPYLLESHGLAQKAYMDWKWSIISRKLRSTKVNATSGYTGKPIVGMRSGNSALLLPYVNIRTTLEGIERLGPQGLAVWYMDDGCSGRGFRLSTEGWGLEINEQIVKFLDQKFLIKTKVHKYVRNGKTYYNIQGSAKAKERLVEICKPYIHPDLAYKFTLTDLNSICKKCNKTFLAKQRGVTGRKSKVCFNSECQMFGRQTFKTGTILSIEKLPEQELYDFTLPRNHNFIGNNFLTHQCTDELDTVPADKIRGYRESKNIPKARDGKMPITLLTSTRKFSTGLVQKELDMSHKNGLHVRHWNVIDVTEKCLPERHKPEEPKVPLYINDDTLDVLTVEKYSELEPALQKKYEVTQAFAGCLKCPLFAGCKTRLATHQTSTSTMLSPIGEIASKFLDQPVEDVQTQLLCRKSSSHGLVYSKLNKDIHQKTATQMAEMIVGEPLKIKVSKDTLLKFLKEKGAVFYTGIDFGFSHNFAVVTGAMYGRNFYVLDAFERQHLDLEEKIAVCQRLKVLNTTIFPDMANPDDIKAFRKSGFMIRAWDKNAGSVKSGIEICRSRIRPAFGKPTLFFLKDDDGCESLLNKLMKYSFEVDQTGEVIDVPMKTDDDFCFTEPTEVLTNSGWKKIKDVKDTDQIMAVTPEGTGLFEKPTKIISKHYKGKGHSIKHSHLEFVATADHKHSVMTQTDWKINNKFNLKKMTVDEMHSEMYWANNIKEWPVGPGLFKQGDDEAWMAGFWLAEGCFDAGRSTFLCFDQTKKQNQEEFRKRAKALNWTFSETIKEWSKTQKSNSIRFVCSGQGERVQKWKTMFKSGAQNKQLTIEQIMLMTESERKNLWEGYMAGDGCRINSAWHYDSISKKLIDGIQVLTLSLGYGCRVIDSYDCFKPGREHIIRGTVCKNIKQIYRGHVLRKQPVAHIQKKRFETVELDESVYCVRTSTGSFLARTNGKVFVAGNCDAFRYLIMNVYNPKGQVVAALDSMDGLGMGLGDGEFLPALEPAQREMQTIINNLADNVSMDDYEDEEDVQRVKKSSKIVWEF